MQEADYLTGTILPEIKTMLSKGFKIPSFILMMQCIEYLGAVLDNKPLKAREQSKKRFNLAIRKLFGSRYQFYNRNSEMYDHLRNHLMHTMTAGSRFNLKLIMDAGDRKHLTETEDGKIVLIAEELLKDIEQAAKKVCR